MGREGVGGCLVISLIRIGFTAHDFTSVFPRLKTFLRMRGNDEQHQFFLSLKGVSKYIDDGKLNLEETKIMMSKDLEKKKMICHFKATDTNHDLFVTAEELKTRFEHLKYDITQDGVVEFIQQGDDDVADNKFNYNGGELKILVS